ncbi:MAG: 3'-5' exonuclease [Bacteroidia bacterium]|nr:3'-5' exonuclease [Bacteroidia bacterium]NNJ56210.1 3'-5' exonuclease [Bacteroidia bacterium]
MKHLEQILFLDIETVPLEADFNALSERWKNLWARKAAILARNNESPEDMYPKAGIYSEFGKIICISVGFLVKKKGKFDFRVKSITHENEKELLKEFILLLEESFNTDNHYLCAHNGKEFDFPYLCRRLIVNELHLPHILNLMGKKPWEVRHYDTMQMWKFGDFKSYTSLDLLAALFNIPSPKDDIDGSMIYDIFYKEKDIERIKEYCKKDVITLANIFLRMNEFAMLSREQIKEV